MRTTGKITLASSLSLFYPQKDKVPGTLEVPGTWSERKKYFASFLKTGVNSDLAHKNKLIELLRFESSSTEKGKFTSFKEYVARMKNGQKEIYYAAGEQREAIERNPNLEYFRKHGVEILFLTAHTQVDDFTFQSDHFLFDREISSCIIIRKL